MRLDPRTKRLAALAIGAALTAAGAWWPMLAAYPRTQGGDGPPYQKTLEAALASVVRYHELPLWNAYECGGIPLWDNPQAPIGAPLLWPMALVGTTAVMALWYVVHTAVGLLAMGVFARRDLGLSEAASAVAAGAWALSGFHAQHYGGGHFTFVPFLYFPLALHLWRRAEGSTRHAVWLGLLVALMVYEGAVYPLPHLALFLGVETCFRLQRDRLRRLARAAIVVIVVAVGFSASRLLPVLDQLAAHRRALPAEHDTLAWTTLRDMFLARSHTREVAGQEYVWPEYGAFLGPAILALAAAGLALGTRRIAWLYALLLLAMALTLGHAGALAPWTLLHAHVFPFREMRVPSRFRVEAVLALAAFAGIAVDRAPAWLGARFGARFTQPAAWRRALLGLALLGLGDVIATSARVYRRSFPYPPLAEATALAVSPRLYFGGEDLAPALPDQPRQNRGRLACWDEWAFGDGAPLWEGDVPQARAEGAESAAGAGGPAVSIHRVTRTQGTFTIEITAARAGRVRINSAYDRQWQTDVGVLHESERALVLDVPPGHFEAHLAYRPRLLAPGAALTALTLVGVSAFFLRARRRRMA